MAIYWKANTARLKLDFSWTAHYRDGAQFVTAPERFIRAAVDIDSENSVYGGGEFLSRVCAPNPTLNVTGSDSDQHGSTDVLVQIFTDAGVFPVSNYPRISGADPILPDSNVRVNVRAAVTTSGYYSFMVLRNPPAYTFAGVIVPLVLSVNGRSYSIPTTAQFIGYPYPDQGGPSGPDASFGQFQITFA